MIHHIFNGYAACHRPKHCEFFKPQPIDEGSQWGRTERLPPPLSPQGTDPNWNPLTLDTAPPYQRSKIFKHYQTVSSLTHLMTHKESVDIVFIWGGVPARRTQCCQ